MNDRDRDLIQQVLQAAGKAGERGFAYLVHWQFVDGLISFFGYAILLVGALWAFRRALAWKPKEDEAHVARAATLVVTAIAVIGFLSGSFDGLRDMLAPEGATIYVVLHK